MANGLFITGTDTEVGKTWVSLGLIAAFQGRGERVAGMKPVSAGCEATPDGLRNDDALRLQRAGSLPLAYAAVNPYAFAPPISPHAAAAEAGEPIDLGRIASQYRSLAAAADRVVVEGVGGWLAPLGESTTVADLARALDLPVIMVVGLRLGCLNHARLTARAIHADGLSLAGWIATALQPPMTAQDDNLRYLREHLEAPLLGVTPHLQRLDSRRIADALDIDAL